MPSILNLLRSVIAKKPSAAALGEVPALQPEYDVADYREANPDLAGLSPAELQDHWIQRGRAEGRRANRLRDRKDFGALIPSQFSTLEIGPFCVPFLRGPHVRYFDVLDKAALIERARAVKWPWHKAVDIDYVSPHGDLGVVNERFDSIVSSHCIEHQSGLIRLLNHIGRLFEPGGRYFCLIPDHRNCIDHFQTASTVADALAAYRENRTTRTFQSVLAHHTRNTHNDARRHWAGDHGSITPDDPALIAAAEKEFTEANGGYIDVHCWYFTPDSFANIIEALRLGGETTLAVERLYPTRCKSIEFWAVLSNQSGR